MQVKKQQLKSGMEQQTGSKLRNEYVKVVFCHPVYLTYMQSIIMQNARWDDSQAGIKISGWKTNSLRNMMKVKEESEKTGLKLNVQKRRSQHQVPPFYGK